MSKLDDELRAALAGSEADADPQLSVTTPLAPEQPRSSRRHTGLLLSLLGIMAVILGLVFSGSGDAGMIYALDVDKAYAERDSLGERTVRLQGYLVPGSLVKRDQPCEHRFRVQKNGKELEVHYPQCILPESVRDVKGVDVEVTAEGRFADPGHLVASNVIGKCPSKYDMQQQAAAGVAAPHADKPVVVPPETL
jgi:cytochrome c-type biogenesis protein CcmE